VGVLFTLAIVAGSQVPYRVSPEQDARIRLSWRAPPPRVDECRPPTEADLKGLPPHMRPGEICEGRFLPFRLRVEIDGEGALDREILPAGARRDRPVYVYEDLQLEPGTHDLVVRFEVADGTEPVASKVPPLELDARIELGPREVVLVTRKDQGLVLAR
jgi:hypothetical protein